MGEEVIKQSPGRIDRKARTYLLVRFLAQPIEQKVLGFLLANVLFPSSETATP